MKNQRSNIETFGIFSGQIFTRCYWTMHVGANTIDAQILAKRITMTLEFDPYVVFDSTGTCLLSTRLRLLYFKHFLMINKFSTSVDTIRHDRVITFRVRKEGLINICCGKIKNILQTFDHPIDIYVLHYYRWYKKVAYIL